MKTKKTLKNIQNEISDINYMITTFGKSNSISEIELDLCLEKLRKVYDGLTKFKISGLKITENDNFLNSISVDDSIIPDEVEIKVENEIETEKLEESIDKVVSTKTTEPTTEIKEIQEKEIVSNKVEEKEVPKAKKDSASKKNDLKTVGEQINSDKKSINDLLSQNMNDNDLSSRYKSKRVDDLNKAINLNDKIWFTKELFDGDNNKLTKAISSINSANDLDEAINYITENYTWDSENKIVQKFLSIVTRRFQ